MKSAQFIILVSFLLLCSTLAFGQTDTEKQLIAKIDSVAQLIEKDASQALEAFKSITKEVKKDKKLLAVINTKIGQALAKAANPESAEKYFLDAYKARKKVGDYAPIRWSLSSAYKNALAQKKYDDAYKWASIWFKTWEKQLPNAEKHDAEEMFADYQSKILQISKADFGTVYSWGSRSEPIDSERLLKGERLFVRMLKTAKKINYEIPVSNSRILYYGGIIEYYLKNKKWQDAQNWENKGLKKMKKYQSEHDYAQNIRFLSTLYRQNKYPGPIETIDFEEKGIALMGQYASLMMKEGDISEANFAYRYISVRYGVLEQYEKSFQYLLKSVVLANQNNLPEELTKGYGSIDLLIRQIVKARDKITIAKLKKWTESFDTAGLTKEDKETISRKIYDYTHYIR